MYLKAYKVADGWQVEMTETKLVHSWEDVKKILKQKNLTLHSLSKDSEDNPIKCYAD